MGFGFKVSAGVLSRVSVFVVVEPYKIMFFI